jgi:hypothetical protein
MRLIEMRRIANRPYRPWQATLQRTRSTLLLPDKAQIAMLPSPREISGLHNNALESPDLRPSPEINWSQY